MSIRPPGWPPASVTEGSCEQVPPRWATLTVISMLALVNAENVEALLVDGERVVALGSEKRVLARKPRRVIDLNGAHIYPAFADRHAHLSILAVQATTLDLTRVGSLDDLAEAIRGFDGPVVLGRGWDESRWGGEVPDRTYLDSVERRRPVVLVREDGHVAVLNTKALDIYRPKGDVDRQRGLVYEEAVSSVMKQIPMDRERGVREALTAVVREGIVELHDMGMSVSWWKPLMDAEPCIEIRAYFHTDWDALPEGHGNLRVAGLKVFADGSVGAGNAAFSTPYADGRTVKPFLTRARVYELARKAESMGLQLAVHAIGDEAVRTAVEGLRGTPGHRVEHFEFVPDRYLEDTSLLEHVEICMQPNFLKWASPGGLYETRVGSEWAGKCNPIGALHGRVQLTFGSDCMPLSPRYGIRTVVNASCPHQRLCMEDALSHYIRAPLVEGGEASFIVTDGTLPDCEILTTIFRGRAVYMRGDIRKTLIIHKCIM